MTNGCILYNTLNQTCRDSTLFMWRWPVCCFCSVSLDLALGCKAKAGWANTPPQVALFLSRWRFSLGLPAWQQRIICRRVIRSYSKHQVQAKWCLIFPFWTPRDRNGWCRQLSCHIRVEGACRYVRRLNLHRQQTSKLILFHSTSNSNIVFTPFSMSVCFFSSFLTLSLAPSSHPQGSGSEFLLKHLPKNLNVTHTPTHWAKFRPV